MKRSIAVLAMCAIAVLPSTACNQTGDARQSSADEQPMADDAVSMNRVVEGQVASVETEMRRLTLVTEEGDELVLSYSDDTEVVGSAGVQGLVGVPETLVSVRYREWATAPGVAPSREAVRIQVLP